MNPEVMGEPGRLPQTRAARPSALMLLLDYGILAALLVALVVFSLLLPGLFFTPENLLGILRYASLGGILVACYTCAVIAGQLDFSTAQVGALGAAVFAWVFQYLGQPLPLALLAALLAAAAAGWLNAELINRWGIPSLVTTLAVGTLCFGLAFVLVELVGVGGVMRITRPPARAWASAAFLGLPVTVWLMFAVYAAVYFLLNHTKVGSHIYAVGGNLQAARLNGIRADRIIAGVMIATAVVAALATVLLSARQFAANPSLTIIASPLVVVLFAGVSIAGGVGRVERTLVAVLFFAVLGIGLSLLALPAYVRLLIEGSAFILALLAESLRSHLETR